MFKETNGKVSLLRVCVFATVITGLIAVISGIVMGFMSLQSSVQTILAGAGMAGIGEFSKALQKKSEK
jgi:cytochrome b subunit of formate dehydrogenase